MNSDIQKKIAQLELEMNAPGFWDDKDAAQKVLKEYQDIKAQSEGKGLHDKGNAIITIFSGAGGLDAEDFAGMLVRMYMAYIAKKGWKHTLLHSNQNDHAGIRNITFEVEGSGAYGLLKNESGVHRIVRISPFNAKQQRHTAFAMVEVVPKFKDTGDLEIPESDIEVSFTRSSGPGGQNVNKRETAVRIVHKATGLSVHVDTERSQAQNKAIGLEILRGKLYHKREEDQKKIARGLAISTTTDAQWGTQIRSYVLHPYKLVKDHRTEVEVRNVERVLDDGDLDEFIEAEKTLS